LLIVLAVFYAVLFRRRWVVVTALVIPLVGMTDNDVVKRTMPSGTHVAVMDVIESYYGNLKVVDYSYGDKHTRELIIDGLLQGGIDVATGQSVSGYTYLLELLPSALRPGGHDCLVLGLGPGVIPMRYEASGVRTDVVEIDPKVLELARRHFHFRLKGDVYHAAIFSSGSTGMCFWKMRAISCHVPSARTITSFLMYSQVIPRRGTC
jgi:hypothetical protein